jgi:hypothetical protein
MLRELPAKVMNTQFCYIEILIVVNHTKGFGLSKIKITKLVSRLMEASGWPQA